MLYSGNWTKREIIPKYMWLPLIISLVCNVIVYNGSRLFTANLAHYNLSGRLEERIPFVSWSAIIYFGCYIFWAANYIIGCRRDKETAYRFMGNYGDGISERGRSCRHSRGEYKKETADIFIVPIPLFQTARLWLCQSMVRSLSGWRRGILDRKYQLLPFLTEFQRIPVFRYGIVVSL